MSFSQFINLGAYGRKPRAGEPDWSCIEGITEEGARVPKASRHLSYRGTPKVLLGISPIEAGRIAIERSLVALDRANKRLRRDGVALLAGVASYPIPKQCLSEAGERDVYDHWCNSVIDWLIEQFGAHLLSVVEHNDEEFMHLHFYVVPQLLANGRLNVNDIHPGRIVKVAAEEAGASQKDQDAAYRRSMERWQSTFHWDVSRLFGHARFSAKRARVSRLERKMQKAMEDDRERQQAALDAAWAEFDRKRAEAELARRRQQIADDAEHQDQRAADRARLLAAETELAVLRARLAELEPDSPIQIAA